MPARELFSPRVTSRHTSLLLLLERRLFQTTTELKKKIKSPLQSQAALHTDTKEETTYDEEAFFPLLPPFFSLYTTHSPGISPADRACNGCLVIKLRQHRIFPPLARHIFMFIFFPSFDHVCNFYGCLCKRCHSGRGMLKGYAQSSKNKNKRSEATSDVSLRAGDN